MSVPYQQLLHDVGLRMNSLIGGQVAPLEATYATAVLTAANFKSADFPFTSFRDAILMAESQFAHAAAVSHDEHGTGNHTWRSSMADVTAALANGAVIPSTGSGGNSIIGAYGEVIDGTDGVLMTRKPLEYVRRIKAETWRTYPLHFYRIIGRRIFHTRTTAIIGVCVYNRVTQLAAWNAGGNMLLPDTAEPGIAALAVSLMTRDNAYAAQAAIYHTYAGEALVLVSAGGVPSALPAAA